MRSDAVCGLLVPGCFVPKRNVTALLIVGHNSLEVHMRAAWPLAATSDCGMVSDIPPWRRLAALLTLAIFVLFLALFHGRLW